MWSEFIEDLCEDQGVQEEIQEFLVALVRFAVAPDASCEDDHASLLN